MITKYNITSYYVLLSYNLLLLYAIINKRYKAQFLGGGEKFKRTFYKMETKSKNKNKSKSKSKSKSIIISFFIITIILTFSTLTVISLATPNISNEIKKDLSKGLDYLCEGDAKNYYNIYNTRKLTEIEKTKFYEKITSTQEILDSEKELFAKYNLKIQIKDVSVIKKIGDNLFLCNLNVNYKSRVNDTTTQTINKTEDYIVKIIDVGNMDYKILLPFNSLDKDFSSSNLFKVLKESAQKKQAEKIKEQRELEEKKKLEEQKAEEEELIKEEDEANAVIIEDSSDIASDQEENTTNSDTTNNENSNTNNSDDTKNNINTSDSNNIADDSFSNKEETNKSAYEEFIGN